MLSWFDPHLPLLALARSPGSSAHTLAHDLDVMEGAGIAHVVCLQEASELRWMDDTIAARRAAIEARGMRFTHEPVEDFDAPTFSQAQRIIALLQGEFEQGRRVSVHCQAGLGRAGTIAACALVHDGMSAADAIATTRYYRHGAIQSEAQEAFIKTFAPLRK